MESEAAALKSHLPQPRKVSPDTNATMLQKKSLGYCWSCLHYFQNYNDFDKHKSFCDISRTCWECKKAFTTIYNLNIHAQKSKHCTDKSVEVFKLEEVSPFFFQAMIKSGWLWESVKNVKELKRKHKNILSLSTLPNDKISVTKKTKRDHEQPNKTLSSMIMTNSGNKSEIPNNVSFVEIASCKETIFESEKAHQVDTSVDSINPSTPTSASNLDPLSMAAFMAKVSEQNSAKLNSKVDAKPKEKSIEGHGKGNEQAVPTNCRKNSLINVTEGTSELGTETLLILVGTDDTSPEVPTLCKNSVLPKVAFDVSSRVENLLSIGLEIEHIVRNGSADSLSANSKPRNSQSSVALTEMEPSASCDNVVFEKVILEPSVVANETEGTKELETIEKNVNIMGHIALSSEFENLGMLISSNEMPNSTSSGSIKQITKKLLLSGQKVKAIKTSQNAAIILTESSMFKHDTVEVFRNNISASTEFDQTLLLSPLPPVPAHSSDRVTSSSAVVSLHHKWKPILASSQENDIEKVSDQLLNEETYNSTKKICSFVSPTKHGNNPVGASETPHATAISATFLEDFFALKENDASDNSDADSVKTELFQSDAESVKTEIFMPVSSHQLEGYPDHYSINETSSTDLNVLLNINHFHYDLSLDNAVLHDNCPNKDCCEEIDVDSAEYLYDTDELKLTCDSCCTKIVYNRFSLSVFHKIWDNMNIS